MCVCTAAKLGMNQSVGVKQEGVSESPGEASGIKTRRKKKKGKKNYEQTATVTWSGAESTVKDGGELTLAGRGGKQDKSRSKDASKGKSH